MQWIKSITTRTCTTRRPTSTTETITAKDLTRKRNFMVLTLPMFWMHQLWMQSLESNTHGQLDPTVKISCGRSWIPPPTSNPNSTFTILRSSTRNIEGSRLILKQRWHGIVCNSKSETRATNQCVCVCLCVCCVCISKWLK